MNKKTKYKYAFRILAILLGISFFICLVPDFSVNADETPSLIAANDRITKTKSAKKINLKGSISKAYLKKDITVNKLNVQVKNAEIYAATDVNIQRFKEVFKAITAGPKTVDDLTEETGLDIVDINEILLILEMDDWIKNEDGKYAVKPNYLRDRRKKKSAT